MVLQRSQLLNVEIDKNYKDFVLCCDFHPARFLKLPRMARLPVALLLRASAWVREHQLSAQFQFSILNFPKECCSPPRLFPTSAGLSHIRPFPDVSPCWLATLSGSRSTPCNEDCSNSYWSAGGVERGTSEICSWQGLRWRSSTRINVLTPKEAELLRESWNSYREDDAHFFINTFPELLCVQNTSALSS